MRNFIYPARLHPEPEGGFTVTFSDIPEAITHGVDRYDALIQAADCLDEAIANRIALKLDIPEPSRIKRNQAPVSLPALMAAKAALYLAVKEQGISNLELARRLGCDEKEVRRMTDPRHPTKIGRIDEALATLGLRLVVSLDAA